MGCGGSRDVVVEMPRKTPRRSSLPTDGTSKHPTEGQTADGLVFSRPGSGPVVLTADSRGRKNRIGVDNNTNSPASPIPVKHQIHTVTVLPRIEPATGTFGISSQDLDMRKGSAQSKASQDSGISIEQTRLPPAVLPPVPSSGSPVTQMTSMKGEEQTENTPIPSHKMWSAQKASHASGGGGAPVPRLASEEILSQLNEIGIVPLKTNRCGTSLAFNIEIDHSNPTKRTQQQQHESGMSNSTDSIEGEGGGGGAGDMGQGGMGRMLPPLPPNRIQRLQSLPPIQTSLEQLEAKQKRAEIRRKNREDKIRQKSEQLRQRRVSEAELSEKEDGLKEKVSQDIQLKREQSELNKQRLKEIQQEKRRKNEEKLNRAKLNREKIAANGGADIDNSNKMDHEGLSMSMEVGVTNDNNYPDLDGSGQTLEKEEAVLGPQGDIAGLGTRTVPSE